VEGVAPDAKGKQALICAVFVSQVGRGGPRTLVEPAIEGPMVLVMLGGLVSSTGLSLFVLPILYRRLAGIQTWKPDAE